MPSPTSSTRPTSRAETSAPAPRISLASTETISPTLNAMTAPLDQLVPDGLQPGPHAGVVDPVADADDEPAQQVRVDRLLEHRLQVADCADVLLDPGALGVRQRHRRTDVDGDPSRLAV